MATRKKSSARKSSARKSSSGARKGARKSAAKKGGRKSTGRKSTGRKTTGRKTTRRKTTARRGATKRAPNPAFMKPMQPSADLAAVVGEQAMPRTEVTKRLWGYIKRRGLQDKNNRRMINADDNLRPVFGGKRQVSMFEMTRMVNKHLS
jgi:upstream activation factor subunit UAF30